MKDDTKCNVMSCKLRFTQRIIAKASNALDTLVDYSEKRNVFRRRAKTAGGIT